MYDAEDIKSLNKNPSTHDSDNLVLIKGFWSYGKQSAMCLTFAKLPNLRLEGNNLQKHFNSEEACEHHIEQIHHVIKRL